MLKGAGGAGGASVAPGGADTNVQYNDNGVFGGDANLTWASQILQVGGNLVNIKTTGPGLSRSSTILSNSDDATYTEYGLYFHDLLASLDYKLATTNGTAVTMGPLSYTLGATPLTLAGTINKVTITAPATSATLTLVTGSSLITAGAFAITFTSTATTNVTLPAGGTLIPSNTGLASTSGCTVISNIVQTTAANYAGLTPDASTLYVIVG